MDEKRWCKAHKWEDNPHDHNSQCLFCKALGATDPVKDPLGQGELIVIKPPAGEWEEMSLREKRNWNFKHKVRILADVQSLGELRTRRKWDISSSTWFGLMKRWGIRSGKGAVATEAHRKPKAQGKTRLPNLPEWSDTWPAKVQLKWLEIYSQMVRR